MTDLTEQQKRCIGKEFEKHPIMSPRKLQSVTVEDLQKALDNQPNLKASYWRTGESCDWIGYGTDAEKWFEDFARKFATYRKQVSEALKQFEEHSGDYDSETGFFQREDWERLKELLAVFWSCPLGKKRQTK